MLATTVVSFVSGALFWHLVGFWTFLSGVVFNENGADEASRPTAVAAREGALRPAAPPARNSLKEPASLAAAELGREGRNAGTPPVQHAISESLADLLQCSQARKSDGPSVVQACPPLRRRLPVASSSQRGNRHLDAREAAERLATGWQTGVARIETGSLP